MTTSNQSLSQTHDSQRSIQYSDKYEDDIYEYRHVILPPTIFKKLPRPFRLLTESEWRALGVQQSPGWIHYDIHRPEPHILLFRRPKGKSSPPNPAHGPSERKQNPPLSPKKSKRSRPMVISEIPLVASLN